MLYRNYFSDFVANFYDETSTKFFISSFQIKQLKLDYYFHNKIPHQEYVAEFGGEGGI